jgi:hypothetical protein
MSGGAASGTGAMGSTTDSANAASSTTR